MPTTEIKNRIYHLALPLKAPRLPGDFPLSCQGHDFYHREEYRALMRKYHVMGSAGLFAAEEDSLLALSSSPSPAHTARRETMFRVASVTKMATSLAVMALEEKGLLRVESTLADFFPEEDLPREARDISLLHLLSHTSGLADPPDLEGKLLKRIPFPAFLAEALSASPGRAFRYSNLGFGLLGCVMEKVTGLTVSRVLSEHVFAPLSMRATLDASTLNPEDIMPVCRVLPYRPDQEVTVTKLGAIPLDSPDPLRHYGHSAGSMYTDADSLQRLLRCLRDQGVPLLSPDRGQRMSRVFGEYGQRSPTLSYGLGLLIIRDRELSSSRILGHQGYAYGCADGAFWEEDTGHTVIFLNGGCSEERLGMLGRCNRDLLKLFLRKEFPQWQSKQK